MPQAANTSYDQAYYTARDASLRIRSIAGGAVYGFTFCFLAATVVAVGSAYDGAGALDRFFLLLGGILAVLAAPMLGRYVSVWAAVAVLAGSTALLTLATTAFYFTQRAGVDLFAGVIPSVQIPFFSDNQAAQILAIGAPLLAALLWVAVIDRRWRAAVSSGAALVVVATALLLTESRGALLGVVAAAGVTVYFWMRSAIQRRTHRRSFWLWMVDGLFLLMVAGAITLYMAVVAMPELDARLGVSAQGGSALSRIALWRDSIPLIADYYFTGSGLGTTAMVYATYAYLLHVPYLHHAHNFYLQVALEQGVPALLAWLGLVVAVTIYAGGALRIADRVGRTLLVGGFAALTVFLVHSLFEADLYFSALGGLVFYPLAALLWIAATIYEPVLESAYAGQMTGSLAGIGFIVGMCAPLLVAMLLPGGAARWEANLGAVKQTQVELGAYGQPPWSFQDQVRRQLRAELQPAEMHFRAALQLDPAQPTAHRRLGALALARGEFKRAKSHLVAAHAVAPYDRAARQMLGEVLALDGAVAEAVALWQSVDMEQGQLMVRGWWYEWFGEPEQLERLNDAIDAYQNTK
jgi:O-antigen ligase